MYLTHAWIDPGVGCEGFMGFGSFSMWQSYPGPELFCGEAAPVSDQYLGNSGWICSLPPPCKVVLGMDVITAPESIWVALH